MGRLSHAELQGLPRSGPKIPNQRSPALQAWMRRTGARSLASGRCGPELRLSVSFTATREERATQARRPELATSRIGLWTQLAILDSQGNCDTGRPQFQRESRTFQGSLPGM